MRAVLAGTLLLALPLSNVSETAGIKLTLRYRSDGLTFEQTYYIQGDRERRESRNATGGARHWYGASGTHYGPRMVLIERCDLRQSFHLNLETREFSSAKMPQFWTAEEREAHTVPMQFEKPAPDSKPTFVIETTTQDTGERKEFFGHTARHVIITGKQTPLEGSKREPEETVKDGWYIDLDPRISCQPKATPGVHAYLTAAVMGEAVPYERPKIVDIGKPETGYAVELKTISKSILKRAEGNREFTSTTEMRVTELQEGPLDPALFEIPEGFRRVERTSMNLGAPQESNGFWSWIQEEFRFVFP